MGKSGTNVEDQPFRAAACKSSAAQRAHGIFALSTEGRHHRPECARDVLLGGDRAIRFLSGDHALLQASLPPFPPPAPELHLLPGLTLLPRLTARVRAPRRRPCESHAPASGAELARRRRRRCRRECRAFGGTSARLWRGANGRQLRASTDGSLHRLAERDLGPLEQRRHAAGSAPMRPARPARWR